MAIEYRQYQNDESITPVLTECPACGIPFKSGSHRRAHFFHEHDPEDFGASIDELLGWSGGNRRGPA